ETFYILGSTKAVVRECGRSTTVYQHEARACSPRHIDSQRKSWLRERTVIELEDSTELEIEPCHDTTSVGYEFIRTDYVLTNSVRDTKLPTCYADSIPRGLVWLSDNEDVRTLGAIDAENGSC